LNTNDDFIRQLSEVLLEDESKECRITTAWILESLCILHYKDKDDECVKSLKEIMIDVMPKVIFAKLVNVLSVSFRSTSSPI
jgi:hypothetical protein